LIKAAILGLVHLAARKAEVRPMVLLKMHQIIRDPVVYRFAKAAIQANADVNNVLTSTTALSSHRRSNPRRFAVQSLGTLTYYDQNLIANAIPELLNVRFDVHPQPV
jgi:hypothetical protein